VPLLMCSIFSVAVIIDRAVYFSRLSMVVHMERFFGELREAVEARRWKEAQRLCEGVPHPVLRVAAAGVAAREESPDEIDETMTEAAHDELPAVELHLRWLSTLAQIATLLGLLGTVTGLVEAFQVIQTKSANSAAGVNPADLAGGVWEALVTTVAGLTIAIPTIVAYNYFAHHVGEIQFQMEKAAALVSGGRRAGPKHSAPA
jgi:biopolymer transport protein ExbB